jgi:hypothetical protein
MNENNTTNKPEQPQQAQKRPNDTGSIRVEGFVKIFDPNNKERFVEQRA